MGDGARADDSLVVPERFAGLLVATRTHAGVSLDELAERDGHFGVVDLAGYESGGAPVTDDEIRRLSGLYGIPLGAMPAHRAHLEIDRGPGGGLVQIGERSERFKPDADDRQVMLRYLALVYRVRQTDPGVMLPARAGDLGVLADVFGTTPEAVRVALDDLMLNAVNELTSKHRFFRAKVIVPAIGALVALTAAGYLVLGSQNGGSGAGSVRIGTPLVIERSTVEQSTVQQSTVQQSTVEGANIGSAVSIDADGPTSATGSVGPNIGDAVTITR